MRRLPPRLLPLLAAAALVLAGCGYVNNPFPPPAQPAVDPAADPIAAHLDAWRASGIDSYTWQVEFLCECGLSGLRQITVVDGVVTEVRTPTAVVPLDQLEEAPLTVDAVLEAAVEASRVEGATITGRWADDSNGVPTTLTIDPDPQTLDDELSLRVVRLDPAP